MKFLPKQEISNDESRAEADKINAIKNLFAVKYNKKIEDIVIDIDQQTDDFTRGGVNMNKGEGTGGLFLAAKVNGEWVLAYDGNGQIACEQVEQYNFPAEMIVDCFKDRVYLVLEGLGDETGINFSAISPKDFKWMYEGEDEKIIGVDIRGKGFTAAKITSEQDGAVSDWFDNYYFEMSMYNLAEGTAVWQEGYQKDDIVCVAEGGNSGYERKAGEPQESDGYLCDIEVKCGLLE